MDLALPLFALKFGWAERLPSKSGFEGDRGTGNFATIQRLHLEWAGCKWAIS